MFYVYCIFMINEYCIHILLFFLYLSFPQIYLFSRSNLIIVVCIFVFIISVKEEITKSSLKLPTVNLIKIFPFSRSFSYVYIRPPCWPILVNIKTSEVHFPRRNNFREKRRFKF